MTVAVELVDGWKRCHGCGSEDSQLAEVHFAPRAKSGYTFRLCAVCIHELDEKLKAAFAQLMQARAVNEGWAYPQRTGLGKAHYFVGATSLCGRYNQVAVVCAPRVTLSQCCRQCAAKARRLNKIE